MFLTRDELWQMKEDELRTRVLIPLFEKMGFYDVTHHHGGSQEKGKDIVMWNEDELGLRVNYAVVVKSTKISGKATGRSSAAEVLFQIDQSFANLYRNSSTAEMMRVDRCWVVCNREITKEALDAIGDVLQSRQLGRITRFIDGNALWELVRKHLGQGLFTKLEEVHQDLQQLSPHHVVLAKTTMEGVQFTIRPKHPQSPEIEPIRISGQFAFPDTPTGRAQQDRLEEHLRTGKSVTLDQDSIGALEVPEILQKLIDAHGTPLESIRIGPRQSSHTIKCRFEFETPSGSIHSLDDIDFRVTQIGTHEATLSNEAQQAPWRMQLVIPTGGGTTRFNLSTNFFGANPYECLQVAKFTKALAQGGTGVLIDRRSGLRFLKVSAPQNAIDADANEWLPFLEALVYIQNAANKSITIPEREIDGEEVLNVIALAERLQSPTTRLNTGSFVLEMPDLEAKLMLQERTSGKPLEVHVTFTETVQVLDEEISLGAFFVHCPAAHISDEVAETLAQQILNATGADLCVPLIIDESSGATITYLGRSQSSQLQLSHLDPQ